MQSSPCAFCESVCGSGYVAPLIHNLNTVGWTLNGQLHELAALSLEKEHPVLGILKNRQISCTCWELNLDSSFVYHSLQKGSHPNKQRLNIPSITSEIH
jgi:hypothetical protein